LGEERITNLKNNQGHIILNDEVLIEEWKGYFKDLLNVKHCDNGKHENCPHKSS